MSSVPGRPGAAAACARCGAVIEGCAFCERDECLRPLCYRCVRIALAQEVRQPHLHGG